MSKGCFCILNKPVKTQKVRFIVSELSKSVTVFIFINIIIYSHASICPSSFSSHSSSSLLCLTDALQKVSYFLELLVELIIVKLYWMGKGLIHLKGTSKNVRSGLRFLNIAIGNYVFVFHWRRILWTGAYIMFVRYFVQIQYFEVCILVILKYASRVYLSQSIISLLCAERL